MKYTCTKFSPSFFNHAVFAETSPPSLFHVENGARFNLLPYLIFKKRSITQRRYAERVSISISPASFKNLEQFIMTHDTKAQVQLNCFLNLGARWGWVVSATHLPLYPRE